VSVNNIFTKNLPSLDLHGETRDTARILINDFIKENVKLKNDKIVIIHGIGTGVLRKETQNILKNNKNVIEYGIDFMNEGSTIVRLKIWLFP